MSVSPIRVRPHQKEQSVIMFRCVVHMVSEYFYPCTAAAPMRLTTQKEPTVASMVAPTNVELFLALGTPTTSEPAEPFSHS